MNRYLLIALSIALLALVTMSGCSSTEEAASNEPKEEADKKLIDVELINYSFNEKDNTINMEIEADIEDGTKILGRVVQGEGDNVDIIFTSGAELNDGKAKITIEPDQEDDFMAETIIPNGTYKLSFVVEVDTEEEKNIHLLDKWGDYEEFNEEYTYDGKIYEEDNGYKALFQFEDTLNVEDSIPVEEADEINKAIQQEKNKLEEEKEKEEAKKEKEKEAKELEESKKEYEAFDFKQLDKNADKHAGELVTYSGRIVQIMEGESNSEIRLGTGEYGGDIIYVYFDDVTDFVEDDKITVYGEVVGNFTYDTTIGGQMTLPLIEAHIIE